MFIRGPRGSKDSGHRLLDELLAAQEFRIEARFGNGAFTNPIIDGRYVAVTDITPDTVAHDFLVRPGEPPRWQDQRPIERGGAEIATMLVDDFAARGIIRVRAERLHLAQGSIGTSLDPGLNAENLASAMHYLQSYDSTLFAAVVDETRKIITSVRNVHVTNTGGTSVEIRVWPFESRPSRPDLAVSLQHAGTGVSQVLAIVFSLLTATESKTFIIDEPNTFLHPKAALDLLALIRAHSRHQFVIATHSPDVVAALEPDVLCRVDLVDGESRIEEIDPRNLKEQRRILIDLGQRLSSFFGADHILWVEGPTEEAIIPRLLQHSAPELLSGLRVMHVVDTGAFEKRDAARTVSIYRRLGNGVALLPPTVGFLFDRERRTEQERCEFEQSAGKAVRLLERRMIENYLLDFASIAEILNEDAGTNISSDDIEQWLLAETSSGRRFESASARHENLDAWERDVHAAKFLTALFNHFSHARVSYAKTDHGPRIFDRIVSRTPLALQPLAAEVKTFLAPMSGTRHLSQ